MVKRRSVVVHCGHCDTKVDARVIASCSRTEWLDEPGVGPSYHVAATLLQCPNCEESILLEECDEFESARVVYPTPRTAHDELPKNLQSTLNEAFKSFVAGCYLATALLCRRSLEVVCHEFQVGKPTDGLARRLAKLKDKGVIEGRLVEWVEALKDHGNLAAHDVTASVSREDASDLLDFTEAVLNYVFVLHQKFQKFKERKRREQEEEVPGAPAKVAKGRPESGTGQVAGQATA